MPKLQNSEKASKIKVLGTNDKQVPQIGKVQNVRRKVPKKEAIEMQASDNTSKNTRTQE